MSAEFPCDKRSILIPGPAGQLEAHCGCPQTGSAVAMTAVLCHPHPLHGGSLHNKVVHTLARAYEDLGAHTVRFNFRGVGASEGSYAGGDGETQDLLAVLRWVAARRGEDLLCVAGFSFGAYVAARGALLASLDHLLLVAPPVHRMDFDQLSAPTCPWLVVQGDEDEVVPPGQVFRWVAAVEHPPELIGVVGAGHFFHGHLRALRDVVREWVGPRLAMRR